MIARLILSLLCLLTFCGATAQEPSILPQLKREKPDMEKIKRDVQDPTSPYYYPRLMEEFQRNDTLMKIDKYRHLYLGYVFQEDYTPYRSAEHPVNFNAAAETKHKQMDQVIAYAEAALADDPFDMRQMMLMINALREKGKTNLAKIWQYKLNYLLMAIVSTGTGQDEENAWFVTDPQHEYVLLNMMNYLVDDNIFYDPYYEYVTVTDAQGTKLGGFYFNIRNLLEEYYRKHPDEIE